MTTRSISSELVAARSTLGERADAQDLVHYLSCYRVDLDILGTKNTLVKHEIVKADVLYDWSNT